MSHRKAVTKVAAAAIVVIVVIAAGFGWYILTMPSPGAPVTTTTAGTVTGTTMPTATPAKKWKAAMAMDGVISDMGWGEALWKGFKNMGEALGVETALTERVGYADAERVFRDYASKGYDLVVGGTMEFADPIRSVARDYPGISFMVVGYALNETDPKNVAYFDTPFHEGEYLAGVAAGLMTKTNKIGFVLAYEYPASIASVNAYTLGARSVNPGVKVVYAYSGSWSDMAKGRETALAVIESGADVVAGYGDGMTLGVVKAAEQKGVYAIGYCGDMYPAAPNTVLTSFVWITDKLFEDGMKSTMNGTFTNKLYSYAIKMGGIGLAPSHGSQDPLPKAARDRIESIEQEIIAGTIEVPYITEYIPNI